MEPIIKISATELAVVKLKELIQSPKYSLGEKLSTEKEISEELNVGRSTVREAMKVLQAMGFIEIKHGKGSFILKKTEDDDTSVSRWFIENSNTIFDYMEIRMALEHTAVKLAIQRASEEEIDYIGNVLYLFENATIDHSIIGLVTADEGFHSAIIQATKNSLLISINKKMCDVFREYRTKSFAFKTNENHALKPHREIFEAIKARNIEKGQREMVNHLEISLNDILEAIKETKKDG